MGAKSAGMYALFLVIILLACYTLTVLNTPSILGTAGNVFTTAGSTYEIDEMEKSYCNNLTAEITSMAREAGYIAKNIYGGQTTKSAIISASEESYVFFYCGHGRFELQTYYIVYYIRDDNGEKVYHTEISSASNNYFAMYDERFVFLWACFQAGGIGDLENYDTDEQSMSYAWLHTTQLSTDGYTNPGGDYGRVFIGFLRYAPIITYVGRSINEGLPGYNPPLYWFVKLFFFALLKQWKLLDPSGMSINEALNFASEIVWGRNF